MLESAEITPPAAANDIQEVHADLLRDFVFEVLAPVEHDSAAARHCLFNDDDAGARYHLKRVIECAKVAAKTFRELEELKSAETSNARTA